MRSPFDIDGRSFAAYVGKTGYSEELVPVYASRVTTLDGVEHNTVARWRTVLTVPLNPLTQLTAPVLVNAIKKATFTVHFRSMSQGERTLQMHTEAIPLALTMIDLGVERMAGTVLTLVED